ncbi:MAG: hypothetical protein AAB268_13675 [Elusimicrobiota bacterium]
MSQPNPQQPKTPKKSKKAAAQEMLISPPWFPDAQWHMRTLAVIYATLIVAYFAISHVLSRLPKPYHLRHIPMEMTPWLNPTGKLHLPEDQLKAPPDDASTAAKK